MDEFTPYGSSFEEALKNLEKVLVRCEQTQLSLSTEKCHMMMSEGVVLGHFISRERHLVKACHSMFVRGI